MLIIHGITQYFSQIFGISLHNLVFLLTFQHRSGFASLFSAELFPTFQLPNRIFFWITFWVGQVQKTKISPSFNRGPRGGPNFFFWSPMVLLWHSDLFRPKKNFSSPKNSDFFIWSQISHLVNFVTFEAANYFLGQNRSECHNKTIGDQKKKFGPPLGPLLKIGEILVFWTCPTQNVIRKKNPWNPVSFIPRLKT